MVAVVESNMPNNIHVSIVIPVYRAETLMEPLVKRLNQALTNITKDFEIILVEDCSPDKSWESIVIQATRDKKVRGLKLSRNFGQHYAITAGLDAARGEWIVVMDCDLQDQPEEIEKLYNKAQEGYDVVLARRFERQDSFFKKSFSKMFYATLSYLTGTKHDSAVANFGIYRKPVVDAICSMRESIRYFPTMVKWVGFKTAMINVEHAERLEGETTYNFKRLFNLALDIILAYSDKPIRLTVKTGIIISFTSVVFALITVVRYFLGDIIVAGYASLLVSIWFLSGLLISILGIVGFYVGKTFEGVKARPIYIISEKINEPASSN